MNSGIPKLEFDKEAERQPPIKDKEDPNYFFMHLKLVTKPPQDLIDLFYVHLEIQCRFCGSWIDRPRISEDYMIVRFPILIDEQRMQRDIDNIIKPAMDAANSRYEDFCKKKVIEKETEELLSQKREDSWLKLQDEVKKIRL